MLSLHVDSLSRLAERSLQLSPREQDCEDASTQITGHGARLDRLRQILLYAYKLQQETSVLRENTAWKRVQERTGNRNHYPETCVLNSLSFVGRQLQPMLLPQLWQR